MTEFKVGDRVKLHKASKWNNGFDTNPIDVQGIVVEILSPSHSHDVRVDWSNGAVNTYNHKDLYYSDEVDIVLYMVGSKRLIDNETVFATELEAKQKIAKVEIEPIINNHKEVMYFGNRLFVPVSTNYISADADGMLHAYENKPVINGALNQTWLLSSPGAPFIAIGKMKSSNLDWKDSLVKV